MNKAILTEKFLKYSFLSFGIFPLLPEKIIGLPVLLFFLSSTYVSISDKHKKTKFKELFIATLPYLFFLFSILYSDDLVSAFKKVAETRLSLLIIPLSFFLLKERSLNQINTYIPRLLKLFSFSTALMSIIFFFYLPFVASPDNPHFRFPSGFFFKSSLYNMPIWHLEPVYFSFVVIVAFVFINKLFHEKKITILTYLFLSLVYFIVLILMVSKIAILFLFLFFIWVLFYYIKRNRNRMLILIFAIIIGSQIYKIPSIRFEIEEVHYFLKGQKKSKDDPNDKRKQITKSAIQLAKSVNPVIGLGIGDTQHELNKIYKKNKLENLLIKKYDTHNQYLSTFLGTGILGLFATVYLLLYSIRSSFKKRKFFYTWIVVFFILQMFTETILERQIPIIIFSLITSIIIFNLYGEISEEDNVQY